MKGFIEGTCFVENTKVSIAVDKIISVSEEDVGSHILFYVDRKCVRGRMVKESYSEVIAKIAEAFKD